MILLQGTDETWYKPVLEAVAEGCRRRGHTVQWWRKREQIKGNPSHLIWWGCNINPDLAARGQASGAKLIYLEQGWLSDRGSCCQMDLQGTGGLASWVEDKLLYQKGEPLPVKQEGDLLVILRYEHPRKLVDNVRLLSPYFENNQAWVQHLTHSRLPVRLRPHHETKVVVNTPLRQLAKHNGWEWDTAGTFAMAAMRARAIAVIDSTAGAQALELGLPVLCYGRQVYRHSKVVYTLDDNIDGTIAATSELSRGQCSLDQNAVKRMLRKIRAKQWYPADVDTFPARLQREFDI